MREEHISRMLVTDHTSYRASSYAVNIGNKQRLALFEQAQSLLQRLIIQAETNLSHNANPNPNPNSKHIVAECIKLNHP